MADAGRSKYKYPYFSSFFRTELLPGLESFERFRKQRFRLSIAVFLIGLVFTAYVVIPNWRNRLHPVPHLLVVLFLVFVACALAIYLADLLFFDSDLWRRDFSYQVVAKTVQAALPGIACHPSGVVSEGDFILSGLYGYDFNSFQARDCFEGERDGFRLSFSWLDVERNSEHKYDFNVRTLFIGWFFVVEFPRRFRGETILRPDLAEAAAGWFGRSLQKAFVLGDMELIRLEDAEFEKAYKTVSTGQLEARYILSPSFMRLAASTSARLGGLLSLSFKGNRMYAGVPGWSEYFGLIQSKPFTDPAFTRHIFQAARGIEALADEVARNQKMWLDPQ